MSNLIIGLSGGIGSGKTTVANLFLQYDIDIVDADVVARQVVEKGKPALQAIAKQFGDDFILDNGELNRSKLRDKVFQDNSAKTWLNNLLHPLIREEMASQCKQAKSPYCLLVAPLLIENGLYRSVDKVLIVDVDEEEQIFRTMNRDQNNRQQVEAIMAAQATRAERLQHADFIIENNRDQQESLPLKVEELHRQFIKLVPLDS